MSSGSFVTIGLPRHTVFPRWAIFDLQDVIKINYILYLCNYYEINPYKIIKIAKNKTNYEKSTERACTI